MKTCPKGMEKWPFKSNVGLLNTQQEITDKNREPENLDGSKTCSGDV